LSQRPNLASTHAIAPLFADGHTAGGLKDRSPRDDNPVLAAMRAVHFDTMGTHRCYCDFHRGFGHSISVTRVMAYARASRPATP